MTAGALLLIVVTTVICVPMPAGAEDDAIERFQRASAEHPDDADLTWVSRSNIQNFPPLFGFLDRRSE